MLTNEPLNSVGKILKWLGTQEYTILNSKSKSSWLVKVVKQNQGEIIQTSFQRTDILDNEFNLFHSWLLTSITSWNSYLSLLNCKCSIFDFICCNNITLQNSNMFRVVCSGRKHYFFLLGKQSHGVLKVLILYHYNVG